jgi:hypothetical protein
VVVAEVTLAVETTVVVAEVTLAVETMAAMSPKHQVQPR